MMNKFDAILNSIKKIISEDVNYSKNQNFYIDLDLNLINQEYCDDGVNLDFINKNAEFFKVNIINLSPDSIRLESSNKQKIIALLGTFIDSKKFDYVCSWIRLKDENSIENINIDVLKEDFTEALKYAGVGGFNTHGYISSPNFGVNENEDHFELYVNDRGTFSNKVINFMKEKYPNIKLGPSDSFATFFIIDKF